MSGGDRQRCHFRELSGIAALVYEAVFVLLITHECLLVSAFTSLVTIAKYVAVLCWPGFLT